jgi:hypothetical protein
VVFLAPPWLFWGGCFFFPMCTVLSPGVFPMCMAISVRAIPSIGAQIRPASLGNIFFGVGLRCDSVTEMAFIIGPMAHRCGFGCLRLDFPM